ncbi:MULTISPECIES: P22AR C-terminal domain-containing protein [unclassified Gilliamella]|uniref:P22AR C-terminal domain-containing protein n=1 Tax=unclassified Gilliamella TaxID=2685620 RepID=UPI00136633FA|nr:MULTISPECIES: P22AR C-terminal domain-containing protein [unclassified Gilliamella]
MTSQLAFHNTTIQFINNNNQIWITSTELARLLQYSRTDKVTQIYNRNSDEFTSKMTETLKMRLSGNLQKSVRIFSLRGAHLVAMFANTEVAKEVRKWLLDLADKEIGISETISIEQQQLIKQAVNERSFRTGEHYQAIYTKLYEQFKIPRYQDLPASKFDEAIEWLGGVHSRSGLSDEDLYNLAWLYKVADRMRHHIELVEPALRAIDSRFTGAFYSMAYDYKYTLRQARKVIERETAHIITSHLTTNWNKVLPVIRNN